jgi:hypothetical protein
MPALKCRQFNERVEKCARYAAAHRVKNAANRLKKVSAPVAAKSLLIAPASQKRNSLAGAQHGISLFASHLDNGIMRGQR